MCEESREGTELESLVYIGSRADPRPRGKISSGRSGFPETVQFQV